MAVAVAVARGEAVAQAGGDGQLFDRTEVQRGRTVDVETFAHGVRTVALHERVHVLGEVELGDTVDAALFVGQEHLALLEIVEDEVGFLALLVHDRGHRVELEGCQDSGAVVGTLGDAAGLVVFHLVVGLDVQPGLEFPGGVHHARHAVVHIGVAHEHTVVVQVGTRDVEASLVVAGLEGQVVVVHEGILIGSAEPVGVGLLVPLAVHVVEADGAFLEVVLEELLGVHHLRGLAEALGRQLIGIADLALALAFAGGDHHHAVTGLSTVDGGGGTVLQDLHRLDVVRVDAGDGTGESTVHHIQRVGVVVGGNTADTDSRRGTRAGGRSEGLHTGGLALQGGLRRGDRTVGDIFRFDLGDSAGDVGFLLDTVTHDDGFLEHFGVGEQLDVEGHGLFGHEGLCLEADVRELDDGTCRDGDGIHTVEVGGHAVRGSLLDDADTHERFVVIVNDLSGERHLGLCVQRPADQKGQAGERQSLKEGFSHKICFLGYLIDDSIFRVILFG